MNVLKSKQRLDYIDVLRGIGIIIMIMGHVGFGGKFDRFIHTFHMPLFFFISGYFFKNRSFNNLKDFILKKMRQLLIPYIFFGVFHYLVWLIFLKSDQNVFKPLINLVSYNTEGLPIAGALWFFTALFFAEFFYSLLNIIIKNDKVARVCIWGASLLMMIITTYTDFRLPLALDISIVAMGFLDCGRILKKFTQKYEVVKHIDEKPLKWLSISVILLLINAVIAFVNGYVNMKSGWYAIIPITWINAVIGVASLFICAVWINKCLPLLRNILIFIGKNSIIYLCLNQIVILLLTTYIKPVMGNTGYFTITTFVNSCINQVLSIIILSLLVFIFNNTCLKKLIGK